MRCLMGQDRTGLKLGQTGEPEKARQAADSERKTR
jgi:hypothetical protein